MDAIDRNILDTLQQGLDVCGRPYRLVAEAAGISEHDAIERIGRLKDEGVIRRVSAFFDPRRIGYKSTLCAVNVPQEKLEEATAVINSYDAVTHNYLRDNELYNVWFTIIAIGDEGINRVINDISRKLTLDVINFPSEAFYKIKVNFNLGETT